MARGSVVRSNRTQAIRLPAEARFPDEVTAVEVRIVGRDRVISPVGSTWDSFFLDGPAAPEDFMAERASQEQPERGSLEP